MNHVVADRAPPALLPRLTPLPATPAWRRSFDAASFILNLDIHRSFSMMVAQMPCILR
jgi:hypothetical protein